MSSPSPTASPKEPEEVDEKIPTPDGDETQPRAEEADTMDHDHDNYPDFEVKEQDRWLPIANVARIMKTALPENAKIAKEAKECMQECVSEFISFITSEASEKCQQEKRKTVNGEDILFAMTSLGFENYGEALKIYLGRYRENLSARGDQPKPLVAGGNGQVGNTTTAQPYDHTNHHILSNPMEAAADTTHDYAYGHPVSGDY